MSKGGLGDMGLNREKRQLSRQRYNLSSKFAESQVRYWQRKAEERKQLEEEKKKIPNENTKGDDK